MNADLRLTICCVAVVAGVLLPRGVNASPLSGSRPNIVVFLTDDEAKRDCGRYGGKWLTPRFDQFAKEGMVFENFQVASTLCSPSRYTLLTGRYADRQYNTQGTFPPNQLLVMNERGLAHIGGVSEATVGTLLRQAGYTTALVGKFHVAGDEDAQYGDMGRPAQIDLTGRDVYDPQTTADALQNQASRAAYIATHGFDYVASTDWKNLIDPFINHNCEWMAKGALDFLEQQRGGTKPFFLYIGSSMPHGTPKGWEDSLNADITVTPDGIRTDLNGIMPTRQSVHDRVNAVGYTNETDRMSADGYLWSDDMFGAVLDKLSAIGAASNTVVIWLADHGTTYKSSLQTMEGTSPPAAIYWPGTIPSNTVSHTLLSSVDLAATWLDLAGTTAPANYPLDGKSFADLLDDGRTATPRSNVFFTIGYARGVMRADGYKYIAFRPTAAMTASIKSAGAKISDFYYTSPRTWGDLYTEHPEYLTYDLLYNFNLNPQETVNLATDPAHTNALAEMKALLQSYINSFTNGYSFGEFRSGGDAINPASPSALTQADWDRGRTIMGFSTPVWFKDLNSNGLPDPWQTAAGLPSGANGGTDTDEDGISDKMEWRLGTDPLVRDSSVRFSSIDGLMVAEYNDLFEPAYASPAILNYSTNLLTNAWVQGSAGTPVILDQVTKNGMTYCRMRRYLLENTAAAFIRFSAADVVFPSPPPPATFLADDFNFSAGLLAGKTNGTGWADAWASLAGAMEVVSGALTFNSVNYSNGTGSVRSANDDTSDAQFDCVRSFSSAFTGTVWMSFLSNYDPTGTGTNAPISNQSRQALLINGNPNDSITVYARNNNTGSGLYDDVGGNRTNPALASANAFIAADNKTYLHVIKFETNVSGGNDRITWYSSSDPAKLTGKTLAALEANFHKVVANSTDGDWWGDSLSSIGIEVANSAISDLVDMSFDNIRISSAPESQAIPAVLNGVAP